MTLLIASAKIMLAAGLIAGLTGQINTAAPVKLVNAKITDTPHRWSNYISLDAYSKPFWKADTIVDESVQVMRNGDRFTATLLFKPKRILSVSVANHSRLLMKGKDWDFKNGRLVFGATSTVPYFRSSDLLFDKEVPGHSMNGSTPGIYVLFGEGSFFASKQIEVTYIKNKADNWMGPVPVFAATKLPKTIAKLKHKENLEVVFYGNSIEVGYNASGLEKAPPFMPVWPEIVIFNLKQHYGAPVTYDNPSIAGKLAKWGEDSVAVRVIPKKPDLVIIGFGMNDGTAKLPPEIYRTHIKGIIDSVSRQNPATEFILIAPMLANPASAFSGNQTLYKAELDKLARTGAVVADLTGVHTELLKHKSYQDMTGNNVNHPNDYLARWYAQIICGLLIK
ncbi:MAG: SGNH/GDSL hydrolase family protein [Bacteroidota bacterium]|nr:SGNH/GDSL hydrolase family protein [Bacteroidota bacterium]